MYQLTALFKGIKTDIPLIKKDVLWFISVQIGLSIANAIYAQKILPKLPIKEFAFVHLAIIIVPGLISILNLYTFQKEYSKKIECTCEISTIPSFLLSALKVYGIQFLLFLAVFAAYIIIASFLFTCTGNADTTLIDTPLFWIVIVLTVVCTFLWFYRLLFVANILVYKRSQYKSKVIIRESKSLVKKHLLLVCTSIFLPLILSIPQYNYLYKNPGAVQFSPFFTILSNLFSCFFSVLFVYTTVYTIKEKPEDFALFEIHASAQEN